MADTAAGGFFSSVPSRLYERRWWGGLGLPFSLCTGLSTLPTAIHPVCQRVVRLTTTQEAIMVSSTRTSSPIARIESTPAAILQHLHGVALHDVPMTDAELMRYNVEALCSHMLWLRAWWEGHEQANHAADRRAAACIDDHFIDGAIFARGIARQAGFDLGEERIRNYSWGRNTQNLRMVAGGAQ